MPLFYQQVIDEYTKLAIWRISEPESFFLERVPLKKEVHHPHKRLQHLAGRWLLTELFPDFPLEEILIADTRKPFLENERYHFSISHCGQFAAAIASSKKRVGVDVELVTPKLEKIHHKFLSEQEWQLAIHVLPKLKELELESGEGLIHSTMEAENANLLRTVLWSAKESVFKWYGWGGVDFKKHMQLAGDVSVAHPPELILPFVFQKQTPVPLSVHTQVFDALVLSWVVQ